MDLQDKQSKWQCINNIFGCTCRKEAAVEHCYHIPSANGTDSSDSVAVHDADEKRLGLAAMH